jgi:acetyl esterase/lipase
MLRLVLLVFFLLLSLLTIFRAPAYYVWLTAIVVTEYPLILFGITALLTLLGIWIAPYRMAGNIIGILAMLLYMLPIVRANMISGRVQSEMKLAFAKPAFPIGKPFSFWEMFDLKANIRDTTFSYIKYSDKSLTLDFYQYQAEAIVLPRPCVIVVHGGSWSSGDSQQLPELNSYLAVHGYNVASINYRMAPKYQTPAPVEDIANAIKYLTAHAEELHIDTNQFVLLGRSAGAQIALLAAYTLHDARIKGVIDFYGPADMVWGYSIPSNPLIMDSRKVMRDYIGGSYEQVPDKYVACSPIEFVDSKSVPTLIIHGENDVLVSREHSRRLDLKLQQNGIPHYWLKLPWATHGFDFNLNGPGGQLSTYAVETFLNTVTQ